MNCNCSPTLDYMCDEHLRKLNSARITTFSTGAIRDSQQGKNDWTETISWTALDRYAKYMTGKKEKYGAGNFKLGIDIQSYEQSIPRHWHKYFTNKYERGNNEPEEDHLAALLFNILGIMHQEEMAKKDAEQIDKGLGYKPMYPLHAPGLSVNITNV